MTDILLNLDEENALRAHEATIERGLKTFVEVGNSLMAIRDARLYRAEYATFEDYCRERWNLKQSRAYQLMDAARVIGNLQSSTIVELPITESQARPLSSLPAEEQHIVWQTAVDTAPNGKVTAAHVADTVERFKYPYECSGCGNVIPAGQNHICAIPPRLSDVQRLNLSANNEWYTPAPYIEAARDVLGGIDLDPASNPIANQTVQAARYFTKDSDGLSQEWRGRLWLNPPYGFANGNESHQAVWSRRLVDEYRAGNVTAAILLVNAVPGNRWFARLWDFPICFPDHRIRFYDENGELGQPTHSNALVYMGPHVARFAQAFSAFGVVAVRYGTEARHAS
jgi:hypothetical protein